MGQAITCAKASSAPETILVASDCELTCALLRRLLGRAGYIVIETRDGAETLEEIAREAPDLVLLDLRLPLISGAEILRHVRREHDGADLPIIIIAPHAEVDIAANCLGDGANDYIAMPIVWPILRARLDALFYRRYPSAASPAPSDIAIAEEEMRAD